MTYAGRSSELTPIEAYIIEAYIIEACIKDTREIISATTVYVVTKPPYNNLYTDVAGINSCDHSDQLPAVVSRSPEPRGPQLVEECVSVL
jgi:hypothetical protein